MNRTEFIGKLEALYTGDRNCFEELLTTYDELERTIIIMENYLELIYDLGYDYDGLTEARDLQDLINELCRYASLGRAYNTTEIIYENNDKKYNILHEELKGE